MTSRRPTGRSLWKAQHRADLWWHVGLIDPLRSSMADMIYRVCSRKVPHRAGTTYA